MPEKGAAAVAKVIDCQSTISIALIPLLAKLQYLLPKAGVAYTLGMHLQGVTLGPASAALSPSLPVASFSFQVHDVLRGESLVSESTI
jgi:hypothetical protein